MSTQSIRKVGSRIFSRDHWMPDISTKQEQLICDPKVNVLLSGPRLSTKTIGVTHALAWKLWTLPDHAGLMLGRNIADNLNEGSWSDLVNHTIPQWIDGDFGMEWVTKPKMDFSTHWNYFEVTNQHGGVSRAWLASLDHEDKAEQKFKSKRFGWIYITELSNFKQRKTFDVLKKTLRVMGWGTGRPHQIICDTNPSEEGEDSWIWKLWYWQRTVDLDNMNEDQAEALSLNGLSDSDRETAITALRELQDELSLHEYTIDDNIWMTDAEKRALWADYAHDNNTLLRYYYGRWVKSAGSSLFKAVWKPSIHLVGDLPTPTEPNPAVLIPEEDCIELISGSDLGAVNNAIVIIEPWKKLLDDGTVRVAFKVLDEYIKLGERIKTSVIVEEWMRMIEFWQKMVGKPIMWRHWSDHSSFTSYNKMTDSTEHVEIRKMSEGVIAIRSAQQVKGNNSIDRRADLVQRLLHSDRLCVSRSTCPHVSAMFAGLKRNRRGNVDKASIHKHAFDALSYALSMEVYSELALPSADGKVGTLKSTPILATKP